MQSALEIVQNMLAKGDADYHNNEWIGRKLLDRIQQEITQLSRENRNFVRQFERSGMRHREITGNIPNSVPKIDTLMELTRINECMNRLFTFIWGSQSADCWTYHDLEHLSQSITAFYDPSMSIEEKNDKQQFENTQLTRGQRREQLTSSIHLNQTMILHELAKLRERYGPSGRYSAQSKLLL